jgi:RNA polymerase sigma-70 factor (ECF subfamily)
MVVIRTPDDPLAPLGAELLRYSGWIRRLATSLAAGADLADDALQDTWESALRRPPQVGAGQPLRPWLRAVVRRQAFNRSRTRKRREQVEADAVRESRAAGGGGMASPEELLARLEIHRLLVEAVARLDEPYRQTVLLRYFDGLTSADIAARMNVPAATVRGRLKTAMGLLRAALDGRCGGRQRWLDLVAKLDDLQPGGGAGGDGVGADADAAGEVSSGAMDPGGAEVAIRSTRGLGRAGTVLLGATLAAAAAAPAVWWVATASNDRQVTGAPLAADDRAPDAPSSQEQGQDQDQPEKRDRHPPRSRPQRALVVAPGSVAPALPGAVPALGLPRSALPELYSVFGTVPLADALSDLRSSAQVSAGRGGGLANVAVMVVRGPGAAPEAPADAGGSAIAVTKRDGRFELSLPGPGTYTLEARHQVLGSLMLEVAAGTTDARFVFATRPLVEPRPRSAPGSCRIAVRGDSPIAAACRAGGIASAKTAMKKMVAAAKASGHKSSCEGCHRDLDAYELLPGAEQRFASAHVAVATRKVAATLRESDGGPAR